MVVLTIALVPSVGFGGGDGRVIERTTSSSMESIFIAVENPDNVTRSYRVFALGKASDTPLAAARILPVDQVEVPGGDSKRALAVFERLRPGELREGRVCFAPINRPADKTCQAFAIERL